MATRALGVRDYRRGLTDLGDGLALEDEDRLLDVVAVQWQAGAGLELGLPRGDVVGVAVPLTDVWDGHHPVASVERDNGLRSDQQVGWQRLVRHGWSPGSW